MKLTCIIVDDEFLARQLLEGYAKKIPHLEVVALCESAFEAMEILQQQSIDLMFLDVNMPELTGINFIKSLKHKPEVIITTAYSEHALEGYQLDVVEYLLKPIYFDRFLQAVSKVSDLLALKAKAKQIKQPTTINTEGDSFFIKTGPQKISRIKLTDIIYIESLHEYVRIHLKAEHHTLYHSLKSLLDVLPDDQFIQIHRSFIINFNRVTFIEGNVVKLGEIELSIGKNYRDDFMNRVKSFSIGLRTSAKNDDESKS